MEDKDVLTLPEDITSLHKELDLIQDCISRMAKNSFMLKGWAVTVVVITWATIGAQNSTSLFLLTEKRYRKLYVWVLSERLEKKSSAHLYDLNPLRFKDEAGSGWKCFLSKTLLPFYGALVLVIVGAVFVCQLCI